MVGFGFEEGGGGGMGGRDWIGWFGVWFFLGGCGGERVVSVVFGGVLIWSKCAGVLRGIF